MPAYSDFKSLYYITKERLEFDFGTGGGWEDVTTFLEEFNIIQDSSEGIAGLTTRELELNLFVENYDPKWFKKNIKVRLYQSVSVDNGVSYHEEKLFEGLTKGQQSQMSLEITLDCVQKEDVDYLLLSNSSDVDLFEWNPNPKGTYESDSKILQKIFNNTLITGTGIIFDENPALTTFNFRPDSATNKNKNNFVFKSERKDSVNQLLLALGVFGGFSVDGKFRIKKRVWNTPTASETLTTDLIYENSFSNLNLSSLYNFNSVDVQGFGFEHSFLSPTSDSSGNSVFGLIDWENTTNPTNIDISKMKRKIEISNWVVPANGQSQKFFELQDFVISDIEDYLYMDAKAYQNDDGTNPVLDKINILNLAYTNNLVFDGVNDYITIAHNTKFNITGNLSITAWINPIYKGDFQMITTKTVANGATNNTFELRLDPNGYLQFLFYDTALRTLTASIPVTWSKWQHIALVKNVSGGTHIITLYIDGVNAGFITGTFTNATTNTSPVLIGVRHDFVGANCFAGSIQDLRFYNTFLLQGEILESRSFVEYVPVAFPTTPKRAIARYNLAEGTGTTALDTGSGLIMPPLVNGTLTNFSGGFWQTSPAPVVSRTNSGVSFFTNFSNSEFTQTVKLTSRNQNDFNVFIKEINIFGRTIYQKNKEISEENTAVSTGEIKVKREYKSYYINSSGYAQTLATNLRSVYGNLEYYEFEITFLPLLEVGDIVTFNTYIDTNIKGVILRIMTNYKKGSFGTSKILVKKI